VLPLAPGDLPEVLPFSLNLSQNLVQTKKFGGGFGNSRNEIAALAV
jgi:hypothetical protein